MLPLYKRVLGDSFNQLPSSIQGLHNVYDIKSYSGQCDVFEGKHWFCRIVAVLLSLPKSGKNQDIRVTFSPDGDKEIWTRQFSQHVFKTTQWLKDGKLYERAGVIVFRFAIIPSSEQLKLQLEQVYFLGIPVFRLFKPSVYAVESDRDAVFHFSIEVSFPYVGRLIKYEGDLTQVN